MANERASMEAVFFINPEPDGVLVHAQPSKLLAALFSGLEGSTEHH